MRHHARASSTVLAIATTFSSSNLEHMLVPATTRRRRYLPSANELQGNRHAVNSVGIICVGLVEQEGRGDTHWPDLHSAWIMPSRLEKGF